jgi:imidazoleglycerol phosphate dehydratase HisB
MADKARKAEVVRETKETSIKVSVDVDGSGKSTISTGVGFFDHMLESFAKHSAMDINVEAKGDLHIDQHHTMEDVGIVLGQAFKEAVGGYSSVIRFGHAYVPMDETLVRASVDLCNRPYLIWKVELHPGQGRRRRYRAVQGILPRLRDERRRVPAPGTALRRELAPHRGSQLQVAGAGAAGRRGGG